MLKTNKIVEHVTLLEKNPLEKDPSMPLKEFKAADLNFSEVKTIYTLIRAISSDKLTKNFHYFSQESLMGDGKDSKDIRPTGYRSWIEPYAKPILKEHESGLSWFSSPTAPFGRIVVSGFNKLKETEKAKKKGCPGTENGSGYMWVVAAITDPEGIERVLNRTYHTVSIGCSADEVIDSITGQDLIALMNSEDDDEDDYEYHYPGQVYDGKLCYFDIRGVTGDELSFVNVPADDLAAVMRPDIGEENMQLLLGEKSGESFDFFDLKTKEKVAFSTEGYCVDKSYFSNSLEEKGLWQVDINFQENKKMPVTESVNIKEKLEKALQEEVAQNFNPDVIEAILSTKELQVANEDVFRSILDEALSIESTLTERLAKVICSVYTELAENNEFLVKEKTIEEKLNELLESAKNDEGAFVYTDSISAVLTDSTAELTESLNDYMFKTYGVCYKEGALWSVSRVLELDAEVVPLFETDSKIVELNSVLSEATVPTVSVHDYIESGQNFNLDKSLRQALSSLFGVIEEFSVSKEQIDKFSVAYSVFSSTYLQRAIETSLAKESTNKETEETNPAQKTSQEARTSNSKKKIRILKTN